MVGFVSLQSPHFLQPRSSLSSSETIGFFGLFFSKLFFLAAAPPPGSARPWFSQSKLSVCRRTRHKQTAQQCPCFVTPCSLENMGYTTLVQVLVKFTTGPCTSCSLQAVASTWEDKSSILDIHECAHNQINHHLLAFKLFFSPKSNT